MFPKATEYNSIQFRPNIWSVVIKLTYKKSFMYRSKFKLETNLYQLNRIQGFELRHCN